MGKRLHVSLGYEGESATPQSPTTLPVDILDADGATLGRVTVQPYRVTTFELPEGTPDPVLLKLTLPSGEKRIKRVVLGTSDEASVALLTDYVSPNEWLNWSRLQVRLGSLSMLHFEGSGVGELWTILWRRAPAGWEPVDINPMQQRNAPYATQFELELPPGSFLLHIGGTRLPWRFIGLPGASRVRILISPAAPADPRTEPVSVTWSRLKPDEESLLAYLARDAIRQAETLVGEPQLAERLLFGKYDDPISACVGAYYLVKVGQLNRLHDWPKNLYRDFPWLPDSAALYATQLLRKASPDLGEVAVSVRDALGRGLPIFAEGLRLLHEAVQLLSATQMASEMQETRGLVERYVVAQSRGSFALSFYGVAPDQPNPDRVIGSPDAPRLMPLRRTVLKASTLARAPGPRSRQTAPAAPRGTEGVHPSQPSASRWRLPAVRDIKPNVELGTRALRLR